MAMVTACAAARHSGMHQALPATSRNARQLARSANKGPRTCHGVRHDWRCNQGLKRGKHVIAKHDIAAVFEEVELRRVLREIATCALQSPRASPRLSQWRNAPPDCTFTKVKLLPLVMDRRSFLVAVVAVVAAVDAANRNKSRVRKPHRPRRDDRPSVATRYCAASP